MGQKSWRPKKFAEAVIIILFYFILFFDTKLKTMDSLSENEQRN